MFFDALSNEFMKNYLIRFSFLLACTIIFFQNASLDTYYIQIEEAQEISLLEDESEHLIVRQIYLKGIIPADVNQSFSINGHSKNLISRSEEIETPPPENSYI